MTEILQCDKHPGAQVWRGFNFEPTCRECLNEELAIGRVKDAAPELLAALKLMVEHFGLDAEDVKDPSCWNPNLVKISKQALAAIAKAEGK